MQKKNVKKNIILPFYHFEIKIVRSRFSSLSLSIGWGRGLGRDLN